jgi:cytochrome P450
MDRYLSSVLDNYFKSCKQVNGENQSDDCKHKTIVDLALDKYLLNNPASKTRNKMDAKFKEFIICQLKGLFVAGHGTTANTLSMIYHLLSTHPSTLGRIRDEHETIFGVDINQAASMIEENPYILNQLPYTLAVIKEALRLFPSESGPRRGGSGYSLTEGGQQYPTEGCWVWTLIHAIHRDARYWPQPDSFIPERWLCAQDDPLHPVKGAWRPFEFGPRNCIGQELSLAEMKVTLVLTLRKFDFRTQFEEWDQMHGESGPKTVYGDSAYQSLDKFTRIRSGCPCRVTLVNGQVTDSKPT